MQPHEVPEKWKSTVPTSRSNKNLDESDNNKSTNKQINSKPLSATTMSKKPSLKIKNREKLDTTLLRLLANLPNANDPLDMSRLLETVDGKRPKRYKQASKSSRLEID